VGLRNRSREYRAMSVYEIIVIFFVVLAFLGVGFIALVIWASRGWTNK
jgi:hypothetical protein